MKFVKNTKYYTGTVYEFNLPTGTSCPFALECKVTVDRITGKFSKHKGAFKCYAASGERFPGVREHRWNNYEHVKAGKPIVLPKGCENIRIHMSGDFFNQAYFDMWLKFAYDNLTVNIWTFTKSIPFWINRINDIPENFILTASYGGMYDNLIEINNLKSAKVFKTPEDAGDLPIDPDNDDLARIPDVKFALILNSYKDKSYRTVFNDFLNEIKNLGGNINDTKKSFTQFTLDYPNKGIMMFGIAKILEKYYVKCYDVNESIEIKTPSQLLDAITKMVEGI